MTAVGRGSLRAFRRTAAAGVLVVGAVVATMAAGVGTGSAAPSQDAGEPFNAGAGQAVAQTLKVNPTAASLSIGVTTGLALAGHQNTVAKADSRALDLGVIGTTLAAQACDGGEPTLPAEDQPKSLTVDSREDGAAGGRSEQDEYLPTVTKDVKANTAPFAEALTTTNSLSVPGAFTIANAVTHSTSGIKNEGTREAIATTTIGSVSLLGGALELTGLRWQAIDRSGEENGRSGSFSIGGVKVGGVPVPLDGKALIDGLASLNPALAPLGIVIRAPQSREAAGIQFVDPLAISIVPSANRDAVLGGLLTQAQPVRKEVIDALLELDCGNATYITIADIAIGSITGAGSFSLELGGASATTREIAGTSFLGGRPPALGGSQPSSILPSNPITGSGSRPAAVNTPTTTGGGGNQEAAPVAPISGTKEERGGALAAVAGVGLALLLLVAEADRRKMRRAQRLIPAEA